MLISWSSRRLLAISPRRAENTKPVAPFHCSTTFSPSWISRRNAFELRYRHRKYGFDRLAELGERLRGILPDGPVGLLDVLPVLRTGEAIIMGEAAKLPMRCRITLPPEDRQPQSTDPEVSSQWSLSRRREGYDRVVARATAGAVVHDPAIERQPVEDFSEDD